MLKDVSNKSFIWSFLRTSNDVSIELYVDKSASSFSTSLLISSNKTSLCIFVIDTNALLLPYTTSSDSLKEIKKVYEQLIKENRLIIPGQVAREFAKNRPEKLKQIFQTLNSKQSKLPTITLGDYPLLKELSEYTTLKETEKQINDLIKDYRKKILEVRDQVKNWNWDDPISIAYKDIFKGNVSDECWKLVEISVLRYILQK